MPYLILFLLLLPINAMAAILSATGFETGGADEVTLSGDATIQSSLKRSGSYAGRCNGTTANTFIDVLGLDTNGAPATFSAATAYYRFYFRYAALTSGTGTANIASFRDTTNAFKAVLDIAETEHTDARKLVLYSSSAAVIGTGSTALQVDTWYRIEVRIPTGASTNYEVRVDGTTEIPSGTAHNFLSNNNARLRLTNEETTGRDYYFDDILISDSGFPGAGVGLMAVPNGDGNYTAWGTGQAENVNEKPHDSDTTFTSTSTAGTQAETFAMQNFNATGINTVKPIVVARNASGATNIGSLRLRSGTTDNDTTAADPGATYVARAEIHDVDPNTTATWTESGINAAEVGYVKTQAEAREMRMTAVYLYVDAATLSLATGLVRRAQPMFFQ